MTKFYLHNNDTVRTGSDCPGNDIYCKPKPVVLIELPNGALAGWPTLIHALKLASEKTGLVMVFGGLIEQIEAQTAPPKPPEPTGLGAVIQDDCGACWVRFESKTGWWWRNKQGVTVRYAELSVSKVLFKGVTP